MRITVRAKPNAKEARVERISAQEHIVTVKEPPRDGRANEAIACALAKYFGVHRSRVRLVAGCTSRQKAFEIF